MEEFPTSVWTLYERCSNGIKISLVFFSLFVMVAFQVFVIEDINDLRILNLDTITIKHNFIRNLTLSLHNFKIPI